MSRDHSKLKVFHLADELAVDVYRATRGFPVEERYGLQTQLRRAAVSVPTNIVEGCARNSERDYLHFVDVAIASASEVRYLLGLSARLGILQKADHEPLVHRYDDLIRSVQKLLSALRNPKPGA
jgi:four helix bundle protein